MTAGTRVHATSRRVLPWIWALLVRAGRPPPAEAHEEEDERGLDEHEDDGDDGAGLTSRCR